MYLYNLTLKLSYFKSMELQRGSSATFIVPRICWAIFCRRWYCLSAPWSEAQWFSSSFLIHVFEASPASYPSFTLMAKQVSWSGRVKMDADPFPCHGTGFFFTQVETMPTRGTIFPSTKSMFTLSQWLDFPSEMSRCRLCTVCIFDTATHHSSWPYYDVKPIRVILLGFTALKYDNVIFQLILTLSRTTPCFFIICHVLSRDAE